MTFPQEFPDHLQPDAPVAPFLGANPSGDHPLLFEQMHAQQFEQFCWWLLQRDYIIEGCQLIGGNGQKQPGFDLFAYDRHDTGQLTVFECKCWKELGKETLRDTLNRFLDREWARPGVRFVLILAQRGIEKLGAEWDAAKQRLAMHGIHGELWTALHLTERVRLHPDILVRFFPNATVTLYCSEWMRRVDFITRLQKALVDERPGVRALANDFVNGGNGGEQESLQLEEVRRSDDSWSVSTSWVDLTALLPGKRFITGSVAVVIKQAHTSGLTFALPEEWVLNNLLALPGTPAENLYRPFIVGSTGLRPQSNIAIDMHSARLSLPPDGLAAMCRVLDMLTPVYEAALRELEERWDARGFPFLGQGDDTVVALGTLPSWVWQYVLEFAVEHDAERGNSDWHVFDRNYHYLKIFTTKEHARFDPGYHGFIHGRTNVPGLTYGDDVLLTWDPPAIDGRFDVNPRGWLSCGQTLAWLRDALLPAVGAWVVEREVKRASLWQQSARREEALATWREQARISEQVDEPFQSVDHSRAIGLVRCIERLQAEMEIRAPRLYLTADERSKLYCTAIAILRGGRGHVPYISGRLGLETGHATHADLIAGIEEKIGDPTVLNSMPEVRYFLSALLEGLNDDASWLSADDTAAIFQALQPLMRHADLADLFARHTRWPQAH